MAKQFRIQPQLSPENYIRQKARKLPIFKCVVSKNWKEEGIFNVLVARQHVNSNITFGIYLVDLFCLGIRQTNFFFNIPLEEFNQMREQNGDIENEIEIDYDFAHNLIFTGLEYASELGLDPHPDFKLTKYILEEDDDNIPLIEVECGLAGKPFFIYGDEINPMKIDNIFKKLEEAVGKDGFDFLDTTDTDELKDEERDEEANIELYRTYLDMTPEQRKTVFMEQAEEIIREGDFDNNEMNLLTEAIFMKDLTDGDKVDAMEKKWAQDYPEKINNTAWTDEYFDNNQDLSLEEIEEYELLDGLSTKGKYEEYWKLYDKLVAKWGKSAYLSWMEIKNGEFERVEEELDEYDKRIAEFPHYPLLKTTRERIALGNIPSDTYRNNPGTNLGLVKVPEYKEYFKEGREVDHRENFDFVWLKLNALYINKDFDGMDAAIEYVIDHRLDESDQDLLESYYNSVRIRMVYHHFSANK